MPKLLNSLSLVSHRVFTEGVAGHQNTTTLWNENKWWNMIHESISPLQKYPDEVTTCRLHPALLKEKLCTYPLGESFAISYSSIGHHSSSKFSLSWHFLLFYTITTVFVFSQDLVTTLTWSYLFPTLCLAFQWFLLFSQIEMFHLKIWKSQLVHSCSLKEIAS